MGKIIYNGETFERMTPFYLDDLYKEVYRTEGRSETGRLFQFTFALDKKTILDVAEI